MRSSSSSRSLKRQRTEITSGGRAGPRTSSSQGESAGDAGQGSSMSASLSAAGTTAAAASCDRSPSSGSSTGTSAGVREGLVVLNVGGTTITTLAETLRAMPSRFLQWLDDDFADFPRDKDGHPFIDRDPVNFTSIINYLRGYGFSTKSGDLHLLAEDALYYDLSSLKTEIGLNTPKQWRFTKGPGVNEDGSEFSTATIVGICGSEPLSSRQTHTIVFRVDKCELIAVGVIALGEEVKDNEPLFQQRNSVSYCNTGELVRTYTENERLFTPGETYTIQNTVTIRVQYVNGPEYVCPVPAVSDAEEEEEGGGGGGQKEEEDARAAGRRHHASGGRMSLGRREPGTSSSPADAASHFATSPALAAVAAGDEEVEEVVGEGQSLLPLPSGVSSAEVLLASSGALGAIITFRKGNTLVHQAHWPAPVPPLQFAASIQGASVLTIIDTLSSEEGADEADFHPLVSEEGEEAPIEELQVQVGPSITTQEELMPSQSQQA